MQEEDYLAKAAPDSAVKAQLDWPGKARPGTASKEDPSVDHVPLKVLAEVFDRITATTNRLEKEGEPGNPNSTWKLVCI